MKVDLFNAGGTKKGDIDLPKNMAEKVNMVLLAQAIRVYEDRLHPGLAQVKTRGEVRLSTRKIYRQKGTGGARHGAKSAPIFVGGGVAHGPTGVKRELTLPKKLKTKALQAALSLKARNGGLLVIDGISTLAKTKDAYGLIKKICEFQKMVVDRSKFTFVLADRNNATDKALRNIENVRVERVKDLNAYKVYLGGTIVFDKEVLKENISGGKRNITDKTEVARKSETKKSANSRTIKVKKVKAVKPRKKSV